MIITDENGEILEELTSKMISEYALTKAKKEIVLKNRKKKLAEKKAEAEATKKAVEPNVPQEDFICEVCGKIMLKEDIVTYTAWTNTGKCRGCAKFVSEDSSNELPKEFIN
jgi:hypothetical protein